MARTENRAREVHQCRRTAWTPPAARTHHRSPRRSWILVFTCGILLLLLGSADAQKQHLTCAPDCGPFGVCTPCKETDNCTGERCQCEHDYAGSDCSLRIEYCPEAVDGLDGSISTCLNGGKCVEKEIYAESSGSGPASVQWRCDCRYATGNAEAYAGTQCEFPSTQSCLVGGAESDYAFCVNGGDCIREIVRGQDHPGCTNCPNFEGRHCQYEKGKAPPEELRAASKEISEEDDGMKPGYIILFVLLGGLVLGGLVLFVMYRNNKRDGDTESEFPDDLQLNESTDGMEPKEDDKSSPTQGDDGEPKDDDTQPQVV